MERTSIQYIKEAAKKLKGSKFQKLRTEKTLEILNGVMKTVGLESIEEVYLFVAQFDLTCRELTSSMDDLSNYFECSSLDMLEYIPALKSLEKKGLLVRRGRREENIFKQAFAMSDYVMAAVIENQPVTIRKTDIEEVGIDKYEFCSRIAGKVEDANVITDDLVHYTDRLEQSNPSIPFVKKAMEVIMDIKDRILFYDLCYDNFVNEGEIISNVADTLKDIYTNASQRIIVRKSIMEQEHILIKLGLIEIDDDDNEYFQLTEKGKNFFYEEDICVFEKSYRCRDIYVLIKRVEEFFHCSRNYDCDRVRSWDVMKHFIDRIENSNKHIPEVEKNTEAYSG